MVVGTCNHYIFHVRKKVLNGTCKIIKTLKPPAPLIFVLMDEVHFAASIKSRDYYTFSEIIPENGTLILLTVETTSLYFPSFSEPQ